MDNNGTTTAHERPDNGLANGTATALRSDWAKVADLAEELDKPSRTLRKFIAANVAAKHQERRPRPEGGRDELFVSPTAVSAIREQYAATAEERPDNGTDNGHAKGTATEPTTAADAIADGYEAALAEARARLADVADERDRLRSELAVARSSHEMSVRHAQEAERGRASAEARVEALRAAWWRWYALATARGMWARLRGRLPEPPAEMMADRQLTAKR